MTLFGRPIDRRVTLVFCRPDKSIVRAVMIFLWQVVAAGLHISEACKDRATSWLVEGFGGVHPHMRL